MANKNPKFFEEGTFEELVEMVCYRPCADGDLARTRREALELAKAALRLAGLGEIAKTIHLPE